MKLKKPILRAVCSAVAAAVMSAMILTSCAGMPEVPASSDSDPASGAASSSAPASSSQPASSAAGSAASSSGMTEENSPSSSTASSSASSSASSASSSSETVSVAAYQQEVLRLVNIERQKAGVAPLTMDNTALTAAAMKRAEELQEKFDHTRPDGSDCFTVFEEYKVKWTHICGENIAWMQTTPAQVVDSWMNSKDHRENILNENYTQMGVGCVKRMDHGYNWVQLFIG